MSAITINGTTYEADLTDVAVLRDILAAQRSVSRINELIDESGIAQGDAIVAFFESTKSAITRAIGGKAAEEAFGDSLPAPVLLAAITDLSKMAAPAYERVLDDLAR